MKIPVIYILSNGRSGSTILDLMLGSFPHLWTLGEAQLLPLEIKFNAICGSGEKIKESIFWKGLLDSIVFDDEISSISYFRKSHAHGSHTGSVIRLKFLKELLFKQNSANQKIIESYGRLNADYFSKVINHAEKNGFADKVEWIIDASKDPYRLMWLQKSNLFDIRVIHLTKQPTAFVYSTSKQDKGRLNPYMVGRMTIRWIIENRIMTEVCKQYFLPQNIYNLRYEDLAQNPVQAIEQIGKRFNIDLSGYSVNQFRDYKNYGVSGNKSRWENKQIYLDEKWKYNMPSQYVKFVNLFTRGLATEYGY